MTNPSAFVTTERDLRAIIKAPPAVALSKISSGPLPATSRGFLANARLAFLFLGDDADSPFLTVVGGPAGFLEPDSGDGTVHIPIADREQVASRRIDQTSAGLLVITPGVRHTLRVNGRASFRSDDSVVVVEPDQGYVHCAKAFIRSQLWSPTASSADEAPEPSDDGLEPASTFRGLSDAAQRLIRSSPFVVIGTADDAGGVDVSPRGDPAGFVTIVDDRTLFVPERPGNRIADSLTNLLTRPSAALSFVVPGDDRVLAVTGSARITTDPGLRAATAHAGKQPKLGIIVDVLDARMRTEPGLAAAGVWNQTTHRNESDLPTVGAMAVDTGRTAQNLAARVKATAATRMSDIDNRVNLY